MPDIFATVLLGGSVRPTPFNSAIRRAVLDLPCNGNQTILHAWCEEIAGLTAANPGAGRLLRVLTDQGGPQPLISADKLNINIQIDRDISQLRGTGGVLRDIANTHDPDDFILVANAAQILLQPLSQIVGSLLELNSDVAMIGHEDGTPVTMMLIRCACLTELPDVGYVDLKEQALPLIAKHHQIRVLSCGSPVSLGIRTAAGYLASLRALHGAALGGPAKALDENWDSRFGIVEDNVAVGGDVRIHDSVVLRDAAVGAGSVLVRSLVCPGVTIPPNSLFVDKIISSDGVVSTAEVQ